MNPTQNSKNARSVAAKPRFDHRSAGGVLAGYPAFRNPRSALPGPARMYLAHPASRIVHPESVAPRNSACGFCTRHSAFRTPHFKRSNLIQPNPTKKSPATHWTNPETRTMLLP